MKKLFYHILLTLTVSLFLLSCEKEDTNDYFLGEYTIKFGGACGWCGGEYYLTISGNRADYYRNIPCGDNEGTTSKTIRLEQDQWDKIVASLDFALFITLDYNQCNVCVDGCDEILEISENDFSHEIRYNPTTDLEEISELQQILRELMEEILEKV